MYRLLIVDDEAGHRAGLIGLLRILKPEYLVFEAENGAVALTMMDVMDFDLVLTDIRMPKVDGLSFLEHAKAKHAHTRIAILSAYGLFDYAKRSIALGADDYLLKPVDAQELRQCLDHMENKLENVRGLDQNGTLIENQMLLFVTGELSMKDHAATRALFGEHESGAAFYIQPLSAWPNPELREAIQYGIRQSLKQMGNVIVFRSPMEHDALIGVLACPKEMLPSLPDTLKHRADELCGAYAKNVTIGVCPYADDFFDHLEDAYTRARGALMQRFFEPEQTIFVTGPEQTIDPFSTMRLDMSIKGLDVSLCSGNVEQACERMQERLERLCIPGAYPSKIKELIMYTFIFLLGNLTYPLSQAEKEGILSTIDKTVLESQSMQDVLREVRHALILIANAIEANRKNQHEEVFAQVLQFLGKNFGQDLSLAEVAERFHYHPSYFSTLFKQRVGSTFSDHLTELRMQAAARLLKESTLYAAKIGQRVGYSSAAYFTKAFKKQFGMSPDQYRKRVRQ